MNELFRKFSAKISHWTGSVWMFVGAFFLIISWMLTGSLFNYSNTWQLFINTFTTIATFLMVFVIQNTQNRETKAMHLKLDELLRAIKGARNEMIDVEELPDEDLEKLHKEFEKLYDKSIQELKKRGSKIEHLVSH